jgi:hypothetical protein
LGQNGKTSNNSKEKWNSISVVDGLAKSSVGGGRRRTRSICYDY